MAGEKGYCGCADAVRVASAFPHPGEEGCISGSRGSGTIFFSGCNVKCVFCQNHDISHGNRGRDLTVEELCEIMLRLQEVGCHNINLVTPTHFVPWIADALLQARNKGMNLPVVFNCGGYERKETIEMLEGMIDIFMPDAKFWYNETAERYTGAADYPMHMRSAIKEMYRQVGDLECKNGIATRGLLIRHLVMPGATEEGKRILDFIAREISPTARVNIMNQYRPMFKASTFKEIAEQITQEEFHEVYHHAVALGLHVVH